MKIDVVVEIVVRIEADSQESARSVVLEKFADLCNTISNVDEFEMVCNTMPIGTPIATAAIPPKTPFLINQHCTHPDICSLHGGCEHHRLHGDGCETAARGERKP